MDGLSEKPAAVSAMAGPGPTGPSSPDEELIGEAERIAVVQGLGSETLLDSDGIIYTRSRIRIIWDLTQAVGRGPESAFESGETTVVDYGGMVSYVDSSGEAVTQFQTNPDKAIVWRDAVQVVYLHRILPVSPGQAFSNFVGQWNILHGQKGQVSFTDIAVNDGTARPLSKEQWHALVQYSATVLTCLGVAHGHAEGVAVQRLEELRPRDGTTARPATWGFVKVEPIRR